MFVNTSRRVLIWKKQQLRQQQQQKRSIIFHLSTRETYSKSSSTLLFNSHNDNNNCGISKEELLKRRNKLEIEFQEWNNGVYCNLKSPQQVAKALNIPSTSKETLQKMIMTKTEQPIRTTTMAQLVLQHRQIQSQLIQYDKKNNHPHQKMAAAAAHFSTSNSATKKKINDNGNNSNNNQSDKEDTSKVLPTSPQSIIAKNDRNINMNNKNNLESLFSIKKNGDSEMSSENQISPFWYDVLKKISKPAAKSMLEQLNPYICPMGYDPLASPLDSTMSSSSSYPESQKKAPATAAGKKGSLLHYVRSQKYKYPECVILMRVGEFYEAFGLDAICLVEYCGLNPMGGKARAGCPLKNIQSTLDYLTNAGYCVAVYEEATDTDSSAVRATGGAKSRLKTRMLAQIVSQASPTYLYDLVLTSTPSSSNILARPHVGIISTAAGYTIVEVSSEERTVRISERVTAEAVACQLTAFPPADPIFYVPSGGEDTPISSTNLPFLPSRSNYNNYDGSSQGNQIRVLPSFMQPTMTVSQNDKNYNFSYIDQAKKCIVSALLENHEFAQASLLSSKSTEEGPDNTEQKPNNLVLTHDDFTIVSSFSYDNDGEKGQKCRARPLHMESATQLGLMTDPTIPSLIKYILPDSAPAPTRRFLRRWLLTPPPPDIVDSMSSLVLTLKNDGPALPPLTVPPVGKVLSLVRAGQASALVYRELLSCLDSTISIIDMEHQNNSHKIDENGLVKPLMNLLGYESGMAADSSTLRKRCLDTMKVIEEVVNAPNQNNRHGSNHNGSSWIINSIDQVNQFDDIIPPKFFERNELSWRGRIKPNAAKGAYQNVDEAATELARAVAKDFWGGDDIMIQQDGKRNNKHVEIINAKELKNPIVQDVFNNLFAIKEIPVWAENNDGREKKKEDNNACRVDQKYFHPRDRNGKILRNRYTSFSVDNALSNYIEACEEANNKVKEVLIELSETLCDTGHLPSLVQAAHANLILSTASHHAASSNALGWNMATLNDEIDQYNNHNEVDEKGKNIAGHFHELWPYWLDRSQAVVNTFDLDGLFLLTAPNMSGKSTLMRSTSAAALLTNCGLCAPLSRQSFVTRFDSIFVRGASSDVPTEDKSAFGAEMTDIAALMRTCGSRSLVFVDELGRGTSPTDGTSLAAAILESMAELGMSGIFATHLHGIINLPLKHNAANRIKKKRMDINESSKNNVEWTYKLVDGVCTDSLALITASRFGISENIIERASQFSSYVNSASRGACVSCESDISMSYQSLGKKCKKKLSASYRNSELEYVTTVLENLTGKKPKFIPTKWSSPSSLEGCSCVYVIQIKYINGENETINRFYVGETDKLSQRLCQHRSKGPEWAISNTVAVKIQGGKSEARNTESILIRKLINGGYDLVSSVDGRNIRSIGSMNNSRE